MGLQDTFKSIAETIIDAFGDVPKTFYFHSLGTIAYNPTTGNQSESGAIEIEDATDIYTIASASLRSTTTDLSAYNIPIDDVRWFRLSGFTNSTCNGYAKATVATTTGVALSGKTVETLASGSEITITGPFYKSKGVFANYILSDIENSSVEPNDTKLIIAHNDLSVTPKTGDWLEESYIQYKVIQVKKDPADATWTLQIRRL